MEGFMLVPPERGSIIGRQLWKPRYIVLGSAALKETPPENILPRSHPSGRVANARRGLKASSSKTALGDGSETNSKPAPPGVYLSIYKAKGDWEFISQHPVSSFETCDIQAVEHRKQAPSLPTLVINLKPDEEMEKARKRRSSRTGGLTSKDPWANTLLFRTVPEERYNIYDWQVTIKPLVKPSTPPEVLSPISPAFSSFSNPFATRVGETTSRERERPGTSSSQGAEYLLRGVSIQTTTTTTYSHRSDRPSAMISPSPSLRSRRSDLSSQASSQQPMGFTSTHAQHYTTALPSDLPSPASTSGYETQLIEGWTSAQGRSSALSSHTRGSNSMSIVSAVAPLPIGAVSSTPPGPRETILDRAFKNRVIPGSDKVQDTEDDKISSIARFEALMREVDEKKEQKMASSRLDNSRNIQGWELDEESEESDYEEFAGEEEDEAEELEMDDEDVSIPTPAQRALDYISGRRTPHPPATSHGRPMSPTSPPIPFLNQQAMSAFHGRADAAGGLRPRTGTSSRPTSLALPTRASSSAAVPTLRDPNIPTSEELEQRRSSTSQKRLSFQEFARRLSSTSSLLLVQTNASSSSGSQHSKRGSSDLSLADEEQLANKGGLRNSVVLRGGAGTSSTLTKEERDKRCGWRGSVGVFGNEGGFL